MSSETMESTDNNESDFVSVTYKKTKSRKRKLEQTQTAQETTETTGESKSEMDTDETESRPSASKKPNFPPISGDKLKVIRCSFTLIFGGSGL